MAWAVPVAAQTEPDSEKADGAEIVVVGSRGAPRLVTESAVPVDVLSKDALSARGDGELSKILEFLSPSFNFPRSSSGPSVAGARPSTLRRLSPDQTLVLITGPRRPATSDRKTGV